MTPSELMQALADAGAPMEAIIIAVRAVEEKDAILAAKRATERDRKRKQRGTVTGQSRDTAGTVTPEPSPLGPPPKVSPNPYKEPPLNTPQPPSGVAREAYFRLPVDWVPTRPLPANLSAKVDLWPPGEVADELAAFHRWALNAENKPGKGRKKDWDTAWHNWLDRKHKDHRHNGNQKPNSRPSEWGSTVAAADAVIAELRASGSRGG